ncbi:unnamed protein product [Cylicocyclus nassatus]|uniref:Uncharacterized protein n=1 Tax=Cylicocyclus nassatus TaxID=53992 RepID=A0AA36MCP6_CYLNA|nr:unnamed protein product [Cylicocyclus nassatus]
MSKFLFSAISGTRRPTHLEEPWLAEEHILSMLLRGEVRKTIVSIQKNRSVIIEVKSLTAPAGTITATCSLHDCVGFLYKVDGEDGERWRGDRKRLRLHFGDLYVVNYGHKVVLGKSLEDALLNGTTNSATIHNICGGKRLRRRLENLAGRNGE